MVPSAPTAADEKMYVPRGTRHFSVPGLELVSTELSPVCCASWRKTGHGPCPAVHAPLRQIALPQSVESLQLDPFAQQLQPAAQAGVDVGVGVGVLVGVACPSPMESNS